ncbi:hypothetical protein [Clostridium estertheticum]|nr:hypothetical protein [Clostridium estertheticum]
MLIVEVDEELWNATIEKVVVHSDKEIIFIFKNRMELQWNI